MLPGEIVGHSGPITCADCGASMPLQVCCSAAGYYLGYLCEMCGPWSRETGYFPTREAAQAALDTDPAAHRRA